MNIKLEAKQLSEVTVHVLQRDYANLKQWQQQDDFLSHEDDDKLMKSIAKVLKFHMPKEAYKAWKKEVGLA